MDFARKLLEKYGWKEGSGLGRNEDGIAEALRPRLKRSVAGVGHDAAADHNDHWWSTLYDKAAANVKVEDDTSISTKDEEAFQISSKSWQIGKKMKKSNNSYMDSFVRTAVLTNDGVKTERVRCDSESEEETGLGPKMTDEELFAACGGRTAHKGARHGVRATGKLSRIQQQEQALLKLPQYKGYSQAKRSDSEGEVINRKETVPENLSFDNENMRIEKKHKKKKKRCNRTTEDRSDEREDLKILDIENEENDKLSNADLKRLKKKKIENTEVQPEVLKNERRSKNKCKKSKEEKSEDLTENTEAELRKNQRAEGHLIVIEEDERRSEKNKRKKTNEESIEEFTENSEPEPRKNENAEAQPAVIENERRSKNKRKKTKQENSEDLIEKTEEEPTMNGNAEAQSEVTEHERRSKNKRKKNNEVNSEGLTEYTEVESRKNKNAEAQSKVVEGDESGSEKNKRKKPKEENSEDLMKNTELVELKKKKKKKMK